MRAVFFYWPITYFPSWNDLEKRIASSLRTKCKTYKSRRLLYYKIIIVAIRRHWFKNLISRRPYDTLAVVARNLSEIIENKQQCLNKFFNIILILLKFSVRAPPRRGDEIGFFWCLLSAPFKYLFWPTQTRTISYIKLSILFNINRALGRAVGTD